MTHQQHEHQQQQEPAQASSKATWQDKAREQMAVYGYELAEADDAGHFRIQRNGKTLGVAVKFSRGRFRTYGVENGTPLWSGLDVGSFLAGFWFADPVKTTP